MKAILHLQYCASPSTQVDAWFLSGASKAAWIHELIRCGLEGPNIRLYVVAQSLYQQEPAGLLVIVDPKERLLAVPRALPCRMLAGKLVVPTHATLSPPVSDEELDRILAWPLNFLHPVHGFSGFDREAQIPLASLLAPPPGRKASWNEAQPPIEGLPPFRGIHLALSPSLKDTLGIESKDIGDRSLEDLPPPPLEPTAPPKIPLGQHLRQWTAQKLLDALQHVPQKALQKTWLDNLEDWAKKQLPPLLPDLGSLRNKSLNRLIHLFEQDPDRALRHAIPLHSFGNRGQATPSSTLPTQTPDFSLKGLGGGPADSWDIPAPVQTQLRSFYRKCAAREMQLQRYRRAAYIYAQLLGDLISAANALTTGRHFHEAAILFEHHLNNPVQAAHCLAKGGLLLDAIARYEKLQMWVEVADLQEKLGDQQAARITHRKIVESFLAKDDRIQAAQWLEDRLHAPEESIQILRDGWPQSRQAIPCAEKLLKTWGMRGQHSQAKQFVHELQTHASSSNPPDAQRVIELLTDLVNTYPDHAIRHLAKDKCRCLIASQLSLTSQNIDNASRTLHQLALLEKADPCLSRDTTRYLQQLRRQLRKQMVSAVQLPLFSAGQPQIVRQFELPGQISWLRILSTPRHFFAVGTSPMRLTLIRGSWDGEFQSLSWDCAMSAVKSGLLFEIIDQDERFVFVQAAGAGTMAKKHFPAINANFDSLCSAGGLHWLNPQHWPVAVGDEAIWTTHLAGGLAILSSHSKTGELLRTLDVTASLLIGAERSEQTKLCLSVVGHRAVVGLGNRVVVTKSDGEPVALDLPGQLTGLIPTLPHTKAGLVALLTSGAILHWLGTPGWIDLDRELKATGGAFVPGGPLVLISDHQLHLFEVESRGVVRVRKIEVHSEKLVGVAPAGEVGHFATLSDKGRIKVYRMPR